VEERVVSAKQQVGAVAPAAQVEQKLPGALGQLGGIFGLKVAPLGQRLWVRRWVATGTGDQELLLQGGETETQGLPRPGSVGEGLAPTIITAWGNQSPCVAAKG
jgi:hypothetical protein